LNNIYNLEEINKLNNFDSFLYSEDEEIYNNYGIDNTLINKVINYHKENSNYSFIPISHENKFFLFIPIKIASDKILFIRIDDSKRVNLLQKVIKTLYKNKALSILFKYKYNDLLKNYNEINNILKNLETKFAVIDPSGKILFSNFENNYDYCFNIIGHSDYCNHCIIKSKDNVRSHKLNKKLYTEKIYKISEEITLITFTETTKEINLLTKIKIQQEELNFQKDILNLLNEISFSLIKMDGIDDIIKYSIDKISEFFNIKKIAIIIQNERGVIFHTEKKGFDESILEFSEQKIDNYIEALSTLEIIPLKFKDQIIGNIIYEYKENKDIVYNFFKIFSEHLITLIQKIKLQEELKHLADKDTLTDFYNRNYYARKFSSIIKNSIKFKQPLSILLLDLNGLKMVNDKYGHHAGDLYIKEFANVLKKHTRKTDILIRMGGDEFLIIAYSANKTGSLAYMKKLKNISGKYYFEVTNLIKIPITFSIGYASSEETNIPELLYQLADKRMYEDKENFYKNHKKYR